MHIFNMQYNSSIQLKLNKNNIFSIALPSNLFEWGSHSTSQVTSVGMSVGLFCI